MRSSRSSSALGLAALLILGTVPGAVAGERIGYGRGGHQAGYHRGGYGAGVASYGSAGAYGFADESVGGAYIGAPLTRFPRPSEIVPPAWGYGTYGVPTMTGIRQAPTAPPSLTVIDSPAPAPLRRGRTQSRVLSRDTDGRWSNRPAAGGPVDGSAHVVSVTVPRG